MKIDENTGLPELPAGRYWEVAEYESFGYSFMGFGRKPGYTLHIREDKVTVTETNKNHRRERNPDYKGFFGDQVKWLDVWDTVTEEKVETTTHYSLDIGIFNKEAYSKAYEDYQKLLEEWKKEWGDAYAKHLRAVDRHNLYRPLYSSYSYEPVPVWRGDAKPVEPSCEWFWDYSLTEESIRHTAQKIMSEIEKAAKRDSLIGKYPPKKLG